MSKTSLKNRQYINCVFYYSEQFPNILNIAGKILSAISKLPIAGRARVYANKIRLARNGEKHWFPVHTSDKSKLAEHVHRDLKSLRNDIDDLVIECIRPNAVEKYREYSWLIAMQRRTGPESAYEYGFVPSADAKGPLVVFSFDASICKRQLSAKALVDEVVCGIAGATGCVYGFVECEHVSATLGANLYLRNAVRGYAPHRVFEEAVWWTRDSSRRQCVRGVFWGNYFGAELAQACRKPSDIIRQFDEWTFVRPIDLKPFRRTQYVLEFPSGECFLALSDNPLETSKGPDGICDQWESPLVAQAAWLHHELRRRDLLV